MDAPKAYELLADAFVSEGVDVLFTLMGDGNMHWVAVLSAHEGVRTYYVRHEHCAAAMATAYASATGQVGVASVTCGPGLTQLSTNGACHGGPGGHSARGVRRRKPPAPILV